MKTLIVNELKRPQMKAMPPPAWRRDRYRGQTINYTNIATAGPLPRERHRYNGERRIPLQLSIGKAPIHRRLHGHRSDGPANREGLMSLRTLIRKLLFQCSHGIVIENPAVNRPSRGPKTADVAYFAKICNIFSPRRAPTIILLGETEHGCHL